jgi:molybdopterin/thiamine biosynthesis adenylyltransferase/ubiquitin-protein ligase
MSDARSLMAQCAMQQHVENTLIVDAHLYPSICFSVREFNAPTKWRVSFSGVRVRKRPTLSAQQLSIKKRDELVTATHMQGHWIKLDSSCHDFEEAWMLTKNDTKQNTLLVPHVTELRFKDTTPSIVEDSSHSDVHELQPEPEMQNPQEVVTVLDVGSCAFVRCICRFMCSEVMQLLQQHVQVLLSSDSGEAVDDRRFATESLLQLACAELNTTTKQESVKLLHLYAMLDEQHCSEIREKMSISSLLMANFIVCPTVERASFTQCLFDTELHHSRITVAADQCSITSGNGPVSILSHVAAAEGRLTWALKLVSNQTCCMVGAVKDEFAGFGGTLQPLGWCIDTAGYGGQHTTLGKNDVIAVLADLQDETLHIWVNGKRVLKVFIDGCVRLGLTTWNGSVFEIVDDIDVEDLLQVETTSESDPMQAVVDPESDYSDADSDEDEMIAFSYGRGRGRGRGRGWSGRGRGGGRYGVPSATVKTKPKPKNVKRELNVQRSASEDCAEFLRCLGCERSYWKQVKSCCAEMLPLAADICSSKSNRDHLLAIFGGDVPSEEGRTHERSCLTLSTLIKLGQVCRAREKLHASILAGDYDRVDARAYRSCLLSETTAASDTLCERELRREIDFILHEAIAAEILPSEIMQKAKSKKRARAVVQKKLNPFSQSIASVESVNTTYDGGGVLERRERWQHVILGVLGKVQEVPRDWYTDCPLAVETLLRLYCMSASATLDKLSDDVLQFVTCKLLGALEAAEWTSCIRTCVQTHFVHTYLDAAGENELLAYNAMAHVLAARSDTMPAPIHVFMPLMAEQMASHTLPTPLTAWILLFCVRDLKNLQEKHGPLSVESLRLQQQPLTSMPSAEPVKHEELEAGSSSLSATGNMQHTATVEVKYDQLVRIIWTYCSTPVVVTNQSLFLLGISLLLELVPLDREQAAGIILDPDSLNTFLELLLFRSYNKFVADAFQRLIEQILMTSNSQIKVQASATLNARLLRFLSMHDVSQLHGACDLLELLLMSMGRTDTRSTVSPSETDGGPPSQVVKGHLESARSQGSLAATESRSDCCALDSASICKLLGFMQMESEDEFAVCTWGQCWRILSLVDAHMVCSATPFDSAMEACLLSTVQVATSVRKPVATFVERCLCDSELRPRVETSLVRLILTHFSQILSQNGDATVLMALLQLLIKYPLLQSNAMYDLFGAVVACLPSFRRGTDRCHADCSEVIGTMCQVVTNCMAGDDDVDAVRMLPHVEKAVSLWLVGHKSIEISSGAAFLVDAVGSSICNVLRIYAKQSLEHAKILLATLAKLFEHHLAVAYVPMCKLLANLLDSNTLLDYFALDLHGLDHLSSMLCSSDHEVERALSFVGRAISQGPQVSSLLGVKLSTHDAASTHGADSDGALGGCNYSPDSELINAEQLPDDFKKSVLVSKTPSAGTPYKTVDVKPDTSSKHIQVMVRLPGIIAVERINIEICSMTPPHDQYSPMMPPQAGQQFPTRAVVEMGVHEDSINPVATLTRSAAPGAAVSGMFQLSARVASVHRAAQFVRLNVPLDVDCGTDAFVRFSRVDIIGMDASKHGSALSVTNEAVLRLFGHICASEDSSSAEVLRQWQHADLMKLLECLVAYLDVNGKEVRSILLPLCASKPGACETLVRILIEADGNSCTYANLIAEVCSLPNCADSSCAQQLFDHVFGAVQSPTCSRRANIEPYIRALSRVETTQARTLIKPQDAANLFHLAAGMECNSALYDAAMRLLCSAAHLSGDCQDLLHIVTESVLSQHFIMSGQTNALACIATGLPDILQQVLASGLPQFVTKHILSDLRNSDDMKPSIIVAMAFLRNLAWSQHAKSTCIQQFLPDFLDGLYQRFATPGIVTPGDVLDAAIALLDIAVRGHSVNQKIVAHHFHSKLTSSTSVTALLSRMVSWVLTVADKTPVCVHGMYETDPAQSGTTAGVLVDGSAFIGTIDVSSNPAAASYLNDGTTETFWDSYIDDSTGNTAGHWILLTLSEPVRISTITLDVGHIDDISYRPAHVKFSLGRTKKDLAEVGHYLEPDPNSPAVTNEIEFNTEKPVLAKVVRIDLLQQCQDGWDVQINGVKLAVMSGPATKSRHALSNWASITSPLRHHEQQPIYELPSSWCTNTLEALAGCTVSIQEVADAQQPLCSMVTHGSIITATVTDSGAFSTVDPDEQHQSPNLHVFESFQREGGLNALINFAEILAGEREIATASKSQTSVDMSGKWNMSILTTKGARGKGANSAVAYEVTLKHSIQDGSGKLSGSGDKDPYRFVVRGDTQPNGVPNFRLNLVMNFDDGSVNECTADIRGDACTTINGTVERTDRRGHKSTGTFTATRSATDPASMTNMTKWTDWLQCVRSWCDVPHFQSYFVKTDVCRDLLFFTLGIEQPADVLPPSAIASPESVLAKAAVNLLLSHDDKEIRDSIVEKGFISFNLAQLAKIADVDSRTHVKDLVEEEEEPEPEPDSAEESVLTREASAEHFLMRKSKMAKKKGVGYGVDGADDSSWNVDAKVASEAERTEQLADSIAFLAAFLHTSDSCISSSAVTWQAGEDLVEQILRSALLPCLEKMLQCDSLLELGRKPKLYRAVMQLLQGMSDHENMWPLLDDIGDRWLPRQPISIFSLLNSMSGLADVYLQCLKSGRGSDAQALGRQGSIDSEDTETLAKLIQKTTAVVGSRLHRTKSVQHKIGSEYNATLSPLMFGYCDMQSGGAYTHHYRKMIRSSATQPPTTKLVRLAQELADISSSLPCEETNSIYLRVDNSRIDTMKALIIGSRGTPYSTGCFEFDIFMEDTFPAGPPKVNLQTTGDGQIRFNPNLYNCGKVCLSLLGTWRGQATENWHPKVSTLLQVLCSIQAIIMSDDVYFNEPGFEQEQGTPEGEKLNVGYANIVRFGCVKFAMLGQLKSPSRGFEDVVRKHFLLQETFVLEQCEEWINDALKPASYTGLIDDHNHNWASKFATSQGAYQTMLRAEVEELKTALAALSKSEQVDTGACKSGQSPSAKNGTQATKQIVAVSAVGTAVAAEEEVAFHADVERELDLTDKAVVDRLSRVIGALGIDAVQKQACGSVFVSGMGSLGIEIAKNITLSGVKHIAIHDSKSVARSDLGSQFFVREDDLGANRAAASLKRLQELNLYVRVTCQDVDLEAEDGLESLSQFSVVVLTESSIDLASRVDSYCRQHGVHFILADIRGLFAWTFVDFGPDFLVTDPNGEEVKQGIIDTISLSSPGVVKCTSRHDLETGDTVVISEVVGMPEINGTQHQIKVLSPTEFEVGDTSTMSAYKLGGTFRQIKLPLTVKFASLQESLMHPQFDELMHVDFTKMQNPSATHCAMLALWRFAGRDHATSIEAMQTSSGLAISFAKPPAKQIPRAWNVDDATQMVEISLSVHKELWAAQAGSNAEYTPPDKDWIAVVELFSYTCRGLFTPLSAYMGGIVAQEALKALSGKFMPIRQWMYTDAAEVVPPNMPVPDFTLGDFNKSTEDLSSHIDPNLIVLGPELFSAVQEARIFMVGAGAVGCELLKNYAMLGLGTAGSGQIVVTDPDVIENSNLSRQFLFRERHIRRPKSVTAGAAAVAMNPSLAGRIFARQDLLSADTQ